MKNLNTAYFVRRVDDLGRIVLPKEFREKARIHEKSAVNISYNDGKIIIENEEPYCFICKSRENIRKSIGICRKCIEQIKNDEI